MPHSYAGLDPATTLLMRQMGIAPYSMQLDLLNHTEQTLLVMGANQFGKSYCTALDFVKHFKRLYYLSSIRRESVIAWSLGDDYDAFRKEWEYLTTWFAHAEFKKGEPLFLKEVHKNNQPELHFRGAGREPIIMRGFTGQKVSKIAGDAPDYIMLCEAGWANYEVFETGLSRRQYRNARYIISGTAERSNNWYQQVYDHWKSGLVKGARAVSMPAHANEEFFPGGAEDPNILEAKANLSEDVFRERWQGLPAIPRGQIFPEWNPAFHISSEVKYDPYLPLFLFVDPGQGRGSTSRYAIEACQFHGHKLHLFDELFLRDFTTEQAIQILQSERVVEQPPDPRDLRPELHHQPECDLERGRRLVHLCENHRRSGPADAQDGRSGQH